jgi:uncharacterized membrane protein YoaK (UPF0700 family)
VAYFCVTVATRTFNCRTSHSEQWLADRTGRGEDRAVCRTSRSVAILSHVISGFFTTAAASKRSVTTNRHLALILAVLAGLLNSVGFVAVALYTSHMTGLVASTADHLVSGSWSVVLLDLTAILSFITGAGACAIVFNWGRRRHREARYANVLAIEAALTLLIAVTAGQLTWTHRAWIIVPALCFTMGLQNAIITKISNAQIRTTHVTGMVTDIGIELGKLAYWHRTPGLPPVEADRAKLRMLASLVVAFFAGGVLGAAGYVVMGFVALLPSAVLLTAIAIPPIAADRRSRAS